jgi:hypothetical protein
MSDVSFRSFEASAPGLASAAKRLLTEDGGAAVAWIATVARDGRPRIAPFCPIFSGEDALICAGRKTPKRADLENDGRYVLHAMLGDNDEELQLGGRGVQVTEPAEIARVQADISFQFDAEDPIFRLTVERCLWGYWENAGQPGTRPVRRRWRVDEDDGGGAPA